MKQNTPLTHLWCWALSLSMLLSGCLKNEETSAEKRIKADDEAIRQYLSSHSEDAVPQYYGNYTFYSLPLQTNPGGKATNPGDIITIYYKVSTLNGNVFDSLTASSGEPLKLELLSSKSALLPVGLDAGLSLMKKGEKYRFYIPSTLALGDYQFSAALPSYSNLIIEAEVVDILTLAQQKAIEEQPIQHFITQSNLANVDSLGNGLYLARSQEGEGSLPANGKTVTLKYVGKFLDGSVFDQSGSSNFKITLGYDNVIPGFSQGIMKMKKGEKGKLIIPSHLAYGASRQVVPQRIRQDMIEKNFLSKIPPFSPLTFDIEIVDIN